MSEGCEGSFARKAGFKPFAALPAVDGRVECRVLRCFAVLFSLPHLGVSMLLGLTVGLSLAVGLSVSAQAEDKLVLRLGFETSLDSAQGVGGIEMAKVADKLSKGQIEIQLFPDSKLGTGPQMIEMAKKGELDLFQGGAGMFSSMEPRLNVFDIPYLFRSVKQAYKVLDGKFGREMLATLEPHGLKGLSFWKTASVRSPTTCVRSTRRKICWA
jgi:TRAP-type C4-dicarboxylate transport system substrate-binding protein